MAVSAQGFSVIVRNQTLDERFPGGRLAFEKLCPNRTFCTDGQISRIGFMHQDDVNSFVAHLATLGLVPLKDDVSADIAVCVPSFGTRNACDWLELGAIQGRPCARLTGDEASNFFIPEFELQEEPLRQYSNRDLKESFDFVGVTDDVECYRNKATGEMIYIGRTEPLSQQPVPAKWWQFWK